MAERCPHTHETKAARLRCQRPKSNRGHFVHYWTKELDERAQMTVTWVEDQDTQREQLRDMRKGAWGTSRG